MRRERLAEIVDEILNSYLDLDTCKLVDSLNLLISENEEFDVNVRKKDMDKKIFCSKSDCVNYSRDGFLKCSRSDCCYFSRSFEYNCKRGINTAKECIECGCKLYFELNEWDGNLTQDEVNTLLAAASKTGSCCKSNCENWTDNAKNFNCLLSDFQKTLCVEGNFQEFKLKNLKRQEYDGPEILDDALNQEEVDALSAAVGKVDICCNKPGCGYWTDNKEYHNCLLHDHLRIECIESNFEQEFTEKK
jgi:hypothetical protein